MSLSQEELQRLRDRQQPLLDQQPLLTSARLLGLMVALALAVITPRESLAQASAPTRAPTSAPTRAPVSGPAGSPASDAAMMARETLAGRQSGGSRVALVHARHAVATLPDSARAWQVLGDAFLATCRPDSARVAYARAERLATSGRDTAALVTAVIGLGQAQGSCDTFDNYPFLRRSDQERAAAIAAWHRAASLASYAHRPELAAEAELATVRSLTVAARVDTRQADSLLASAEAAFTHRDDHVGIGRTMVERAELHELRHRVWPAALWDSAIVRLEAAEEPLHLAALYTSRGTSLRNRFPSRPEEATVAQRRALALTLAAADTLGTIRVLLRLNDLHTLRVLGRGMGGDSTAFERALRLARAIDDWRFVSASSVVNLAIGRLNETRVDEAEELLALAERLVAAQDDTVARRLIPQVRALLPRSMATRVVTDPSSALLGPRAPRPTTSAGTRELVLGMLDGQGELLPLARTAARLVRDDAVTLAASYVIAAGISARGMRDSSEAYRRRAGRAFLPLEALALWVRERLRDSNDTTTLDQVLSARLEIAQTLGSRSGEAESLIAIADERERRGDLHGAAEVLRDAARAAATDPQAVLQRINVLTYAAIVAARIRDEALDSTVSGGAVPGGTVPDGAAADAMLGVALAHLDSAAALRAQVRRRAGGDANRVAVADAGAVIHGLRAFLEAERGDGHAALAAAERGRAQALLDLRDTSASGEIEVGADLSREGRALVARATAGGAALLAYRSVPAGMLLWHAEPGGELRYVSVPVDEDSVAALVDAARRAITDPAAAPGAAPAGRDPLRALAELLLPRVVREASASTRELVLAVDGLLALVPYAALPLDDGRPLGAVYAVRVTPAITLLGERAGTPSTGLSGPMRALVVGDPVMPRSPDPAGDGRPLEPLPGSAAEARAIAGLLGVDALTGAEATERTVRARLPHASVVHLATHGQAYAAATEARRSFLALAPDRGGDAAGDGLLTAAELVDDPSLSLRASLVVLSACETALGDARRTEGIVGLQRAFLARGARTLIVTLWEVDDRATRAMMESFYRHWLRDADRPTVTEALRRAQRDVRERLPGYADPYYWAGFQVVGSG